MSCSPGGGEEEEASIWAKQGRSTQVPPGLHSAFWPAMLSPSVTAVEPPSTSVGGPTSSSLPVAGCSTSSSAAGWGRDPVLQLWSDSTLLL
jgi:hypothetical protein